MNLTSLKSSKPLRCASVTGKMTQFPIVQSLSRLSARPKTLVCASAIGFYGDRGTEILTESSRPGTGFLPDVCSAWESEALAAAQWGLRVVCLRIGVVLSPKGGALAKMLTPFKLGVGGYHKPFWNKMDFFDHPKNGRRWKMRWSEKAK